MLNDIQQILISENEVLARIEQLAEELDRDYEGKNPLMVCILKGSVLFFSELVKKMKIRNQFDFMSVSSYGASTYSSGNVKMIKDLNTSIEGRHVVIIEDIVDTGHTLSYLKKILNARNPASLKICTLLDKKCRRTVELDADYAGFEIDDYFVVGFGLDYDEDYRSLPFIGVLKPEVYKK